MSDCVALMILIDLVDSDTQLLLEHWVAIYPLGSIKLVFAGISASEGIK